MSIWECEECGARHPEKSVMLNHLIIVHAAPQVKLAVDKALREAIETAALEKIYALHAQPDCSSQNR